MLAIVYVDESPLYLLKTGQHEKAKMIIEQIKRINGITDLNQPLNESSNNFDLKILDNNEKEKKLSTMEWLRSSRKLPINLALMIYMWSAVSFNYYLILYQLKNLPGNLYDNSLATVAAEVFGVMQSSYFVKVFGLKGGFLITFMASLVGGVLIVMFGEMLPDFMPLFCIIARVGISALFTLLYLMNAELFPTMFASTALGYCNFLARMTTIMAPIVAEQKT